MSRSASDVDYYSVQTTNEFGTATSDSAYLGTYENLGDAVEQPDLEWTFRDRTRWFPQSDITRDGNDALMCVIENENPPEANWMETTIEGPFRLSYWIRVDDGINADHIHDLYPGYGIPSEEKLWTQKFIEEDSVGPHVARIVANPRVPNAKIYIDQIVISKAPFFYIHPHSLSVSEGQTITLEGRARSSTLTHYQWLKDGIAIPGATGTSALHDNDSGPLPHNIILCPTNRRPSFGRHVSHMVTTNTECSSS